jgi:hypothetical protein
VGRNVLVGSSPTPVTRTKNKLKVKMLKEKEDEKIVLSGKFESSKTNLRRVNIKSENKPVIELIKRFLQKKVK